MAGGPSIVFTRKAVVGETFIRNSSKNCKSIVGIDSNQFYNVSLCQYSHCFSILNVSRYANRTEHEMGVWH